METSLPRLDKLCEDAAKYHTIKQVYIAQLEKDLGEEKVKNTLLAQKLATERLKVQELVTAVERISSFVLPPSQQEIVVDMRDAQASDIEQQIEVESAEEVPEDTLVLATARQKFQCNVCHRMFGRSCHLAKHMLSHVPHQGRFPCARCNKMYSRRYDAKRHEASCGGAQLFACPICKASFQTEKKLKSHHFYQHGRRALETPLRKEREVWPDPAMPSEALLNKRVRVWWSDQKKWFDGIVKARVGTKHLVCYDDGDEIEEQLLGTQYPTRGWTLLESV